jgi:hypothetical protein
MEHYCTYCNKNYKSYQSLWKHNKNFHDNVVNKKSTVINTNIPENEEIKNINNKKYACKYCEKEFNTKQSKSRHEKNYCKNKEDSDKIKELEKKIDKLTEIISNQTPSKNINKGTIINNNIFNNFKIELGVEDMKLLSEDQKLKVLKSINYGELPIVTLVDEL